MDGKKQAFAPLSSHIDRLVKTWNDPNKRGLQMLDIETAWQIVEDFMGFLPEHRKQQINEVATKGELQERCNHSKIVLHLQARVEERVAWAVATYDDGHALHCSGRSKLVKAVESQGRRSSKEEALRGGAGQIADLVPQGWHDRLSKGGVGTGWE